jgi:hypothetical protein
MVAWPQQFVDFAGDQAYESAVARESRIAIFSRLMGRQLQSIRARDVMEVKV